MLDKKTIGFITYYMKQYPWRTLLLVFLLFLSGLAEGIGVVSLLPLLEVAVNGSRHAASPVTRLIQDAVRHLGLSPRLPVLLGFIAVSMALKAAFRLLAMKQVGYTVSRVSTDLRLSLIRNLLRTRWSYFTSQPTGRFANAIGTEAVRASAAYKNVCTMIAAGIQALFYTAIAVLISWRIALFALLGGLAMVVALGRLVRVARDAARNQTRLMKSLTSRLTDALQGIKPIKAMGRENHLQPLLENETHDLNTAQERQVLASEAVAAMQEPVMVILLAFGLYLALVVQHLSFSLVLIMAFVFYRLAGRIGQVQVNYQSVAAGESAFWSMLESIETAASEHERVTGTLPPPPLEEGVVLDRVNFGYGNGTVLDGVSLTIPAGQFVALVGPSGAGKTTIADLVVGLYQPQSGQVLVDGVQLRDIDLGAWRRQIGYVPQEMFLFHDSVLSNLTLGDPEITRDQVEAALRAAGAWDFVADLPEKLDTPMGERGSRLSGGQRQRIAIARALVRNPRLLVLDEVTTALDPHTEAAICETLRALAGRVTILSISHQPAMMEVADVVYRLEGGRARAAQPAAASA